MLLNEMYTAAPTGYQDEDSDNSRPQWGDTRKTRLTLRQINKLRRMMDVRNYEHAQSLKKIRKQYAPAAAAGPAL